MAVLGEKPMAIDTSRMGSLVGEIDRVGLEATNRRQPPAVGGLVQSAALSTLVWQQVIGSGDLSRLSSPDAATLYELYRSTEAANYLAAQVPMYLQTANLSTDADVQAAFQAEARRFSTEGLDEIIAAVPPARAVAERRSSWWARK